jgi:hypothetical protein
LWRRGLGWRGGDYLAEEPSNALGGFEKFRIRPTCTNQKYNLARRKRERARMSVLRGEKERMSVSTGDKNLAHIESRNMSRVSRRRR